MSFLPKKGKLAVVESFADLRMGERSLISGGLSGNWFWEYIFVYFDYMEWFVYLAH